MDKYIKAQDVVDAVYTLDPENDGSNGCTAFLLPRKLDSYEVENIVLALPAADVAPVVHGYWIIGGVRGNGVIGNWKCSVCKGVSLKDTSFCPNCGAKMDLEG